MDSKNINKMNETKNFIVKNSHKLDLTIGLILLIAGIYKLFYEQDYAILFIIVGLISVIMAIFKPVKKFDNYINQKIIAKQKKGQ